MVAVLSLSLLFYHNVAYLFMQISNVEQQTNEPTNQRRKKLDLFLLSNREKKGISSTFTAIKFTM